MTPQEILAELKNAIFPSKEDDGVAHVDMSYAEFMAKLEALAAFGIAAQAVSAQNKPKGQATVIEDGPMSEQFPTHEEQL